MDRASAVKFGLAIVCLSGAIGWWWAHREPPDDFTVPVAVERPAPAGEKPKAAVEGKNKTKPSARINEDIG